MSTTMIVVALGLLAASSGPFDHAYAKQSGAHLVAAYDRSKVSDASSPRLHALPQPWPDRSARRHST